MDSEVERLDKTVIGDYLGKEVQYQGGFCVKVRARASCVQSTALLVLRVVTCRPLRSASPHDSFRGFAVLFVDTNEFTFSSCALQIPITRFASVRF